MAKYNKEMLEAAAKNSFSLAETFQKLGLIPNGGNYSWLRSLLRKFEINTSHFAKQPTIKKISSFYETDDLSCGRRLNSNTLQRFLFRHGMEEECSCCGLSEWNGKILRLDVDHIDGNCLNNKIENLQYLCPNCHRQKTVPLEEKLAFVINNKGKMEEKIIRTSPNRKKEIKTKKCKDCDKLISSGAEKCRDCANKIRHLDSRLRGNYPENDILKELVWSETMVNLGIEFGVSDNAVRKHCIKNNIPFPNSFSGYWQNMFQGRLEKCAEIRKSIEDKYNN